MILVLLKDFISNISKPQILWTMGGAILLKGLNFQRLIFTKGNKKSRVPQGQPTFAEAIKVSMLDATGKCFFHM